jgi:hypothetical protein
MFGVLISVRRKGLIFDWLDHFVDYVPFSSVAPLRLSYFILFREATFSRDPGFAVR